MHRKLAPRPEPKSSSIRPVAATSLSHRPAYASVLDSLRKKAVSVAAVLAIAPLGAFVGTVSACGGASPTQPEKWDSGAPDGSASTRALPAPTTSASQSSSASEAPATPPSEPAPAASEAPSEEP